MGVATDGQLVNLQERVRNPDTPRDVTYVINFNYCEMDEYLQRLLILAARGQSLTLFEYDPGWPDMAEKYVRFLSASFQPVPPELRSISQEVHAGMREIGKP